MPMDPRLLEELEQRKNRNLHSAPREKIEARHAKGLLTARERLDCLFVAGTFLEMGAHAQQVGHDLGERKKDVPCDGVVTGTGLVDGRPVAAFSQDFLVLGGTLGRVHAQKMTDLMTLAMKNGMPVVGLNDSGGARIQEGVQALSGYGQVFFSNVELSGVVPQIALILGPCAGGAAYSPYFATGGKYNPAVGIGAVSCVPTTAKVAQKCVSEANPQVIVLPEALGANICGVITSAVLTGVYVTLLRNFGQ